MTDRKNYSPQPSRNTEDIRQNYNSEAKEMRAKAARERIKARQKAERDAKRRTGNKHLE